jgi:gluconolactonase
MKLLMTSWALIASSALLVSCSSSGDKAPAADAKTKAAPARETVGRIERLDPALDKLVPPGATIDRLASGFKWAEGPVWVKDGGYLIFSDVKANTAMKFTEKDGVKPYIHPSGYTGAPGDYKGIEPGSNGLTLAPDGSLLLCQHGDRRIAKLKLPHDPADEKPAFETVAGKFEGKRFNSPNDVICDKAGNIFFTDPPYGMTGQSDEAPEKELKVNGVYRVAKDGTVKLLTSELRRPNGIALSPDEKTLYVAQSDPDSPIIMAWDLNGDQLANGRVFFDAKPLKGKGPGGPDGMKVDAAGNLFATGPGGVMVITKEGKHLGTIRPSETQPTANCAFGGADGTWLYMTNDSHLCRIKLNTKGKGF